jgi:hypothetical protein
MYGEREREREREILMSLCTQWKAGKYTICRVN